MNEPDTTERQANTFPVGHTEPVRVTLIINPFASSVTPRTRVIIQKMLSDDHDLSVRETTKGGHAIRLAHGAAKAGADVIIALGGDGTINEVANGVLGDGDAANDPMPAIVPLPGGSTNVFARAIGYPNDPVKATGALVDALADKSTTMASVGVANGRAFLFHCGAGFDAAVVEGVERRGPLKRYAGHALFVATTLSTWFRRVDRRNPWFSIDADDGRSIGDAQMAVALNCNPYTFLGSRPLDLAPEADLTTDLSVVALRSLSVTKLGPAVVQVLNGTDGIPDRGASTHWPEVTGVTLRAYRPFPYQLDGEAFSPVSELRIESRLEAVKLVVPVG